MAGGVVMQLITKITPELAGGVIRAYRCDLIKRKQATNELNLYYGGHWPDEAWSNGLPQNYDATWQYDDLDDVRSCMLSKISSLGYSVIGR